MEDQLKDIRHRLYKIEDKLDHVLYHHGHEVTPHDMHMTPFGVMPVPNTKNPNSAHNQMKMEDHMMNPFHPMGAMGAMGGMGMPYGMHPGMMGMHAGMMGMHPGMMGGMGMHPGMMGGMGMPYGMAAMGGMGTMNAYNYPDQQDVQTEESADQGTRRKKRRRKKKARKLIDLN